MAQLIFDKQHKEKDQLICIGSCVKERKCPGMIGSINLETETMNFVRCLCSCHDNDSEDLNYEQEQWFKERVAATTWGRPIRPWPWTHREFNAGVPFKFSEEFS